MSLGEDLRALKCGEVDDSQATRTAYSHDASIFELTPEVVVFPRSAVDISALVRYADGHRGVSLVPRGGGTDMGGGAVGTSVVLDLTRHMNTMVDVARSSDVPGQDGVAVAQTGMWYRDFESTTLARGMMMPSYPGSRQICAIGGMVANNAGGERSLSYGQTIEFVRAVRAVMADGREYEFGPLTEAQLGAKMVQKDFEGDLYRGVYELIEKNYDRIQASRPGVAKNASGYYLWRVWDRKVFNMAKLLCGSQGTLGIMTEVSLGLVRPYPNRRMVVAFLRDLKPVAGIVNALTPFKPESIESFDDKTLSFTLRFLPDFVKLMGASGLFSLMWQFLPEAGMVLRGGLPKLILLCEFSGDDDDHVTARARAAQEALKPFGVRTRILKTEREAKKYWTIRRESFNVLRSHTKGKRTTPFIDDFIVKPEYLPEFLPKLYAILEPYKLSLSIAGHVGSGNFHIIPFMDLRDERTRAIIPELSRKVYNLVLEYKGSITAEHNDGLIRGPYVKQMFGAEMYELFRQIKHLFDPKNIFNPGKKIDVDWDNALAHLRKD